MTEFPDDFKRHVELLLRYLRSAVYADEYDLTATFEDHESDDSDPDGTAFAVVTVNEVYLFCKVRVNKHLLSKWREGKHEYVAKCLCHEMCHLLTEPIARLALSDAAPSMRSHVRDVVERQTERACKSLMRALPAGFWTIERLEKWNGPPREKEPNSDIKSVV